MTATALAFAVNPKYNTGINIDISGGIPKFNDKQESYLN